MGRLDPDGTPRSPDWTAMVATGSLGLAGEAQASALGVGATLWGDSLIAAVRGSERLRPATSAPEHSYVTVSLRSQKA